ncbi:MAG: branched-chain amino acid transaminase [Candidatus Micrarchaeia archaeon]
MTEKKLRMWVDGKFVSEDDAHVPILTHSLQYGSGIFEGIRSYDTGKGAAIFRLDDHINRFFNSAKIYSMNLGYSFEEIKKAIIDTVAKNNLLMSYIRPFAFYNDAHIGVSVDGKKVSVAIAAIPFGKYFSNASSGVKCKISSWRRINSDILPVEAKASGNYINSIIASNEAKASGFDEAILLSENGYVAEGPGENIFIVKNGDLLTPSRSSDILLGITRDTLLKLSADLGISATERLIHKEELYTCDEAFFAGTAAEITPIINIDGITISNGKPGKLTQKLADLYYGIVSGKNKKYSKWLTYV